MPEQNSYAELLKSSNWKNKRDYILERDNHKCTKCKTTSSIWIPNSGESGGTHIVIIENNPITEFPKEVRKEVRFLQIHHKYYIIENNELLKPWDYADEVLMTVCHICHSEIHKSENIKIYTRINGNLLNDDQYSLCTRCGGEGYLPEYSHVQNGICFKCNGNRIYNNSVFKI